MGGKDGSGSVPVRVFGKGERPLDWIVWDGFIVEPGRQGTVVSWHAPEFSAFLLAGIFSQGHRLLRCELEDPDPMGPYRAFFPTTAYRFVARQLEAYLFLAGEGLRYGHAKRMRFARFVAASLDTSHTSKRCLRELERARLINSPMRRLLQEFKVQHGLE